MTLLHLLSYAGAIATFLFVTLSLASGLLWLAELIEEHSRTAKVVGKRAIYAIIALHVLLYLIDGFPLLLILFSITAHIVYLQNFTSQWPFISLTSARFLLSCCMVVADHFLWFFYFAEKAQEAKRYNNSSKRFRNTARGRQTVSSATVDSPSFMDVAAFFAVCVWFVPLFLFLSLSANDNVLPRMDQIPGTPAGLGDTVDLTHTPGGHRTLGKIDTKGTYDYFAASTDASGSSSTTRRSLLKSVLAPVFFLLPGRRTGSGSRQNDEGIIAPRTPLKGSPMPSPHLAPNLALSRQPSISGGSGGPYIPWGEDVSPASGSGYGTPVDSRPASPGLSARHAHHFLDPSPRGVSPNMNGNGGTGGANLAAPPISSINQRRGNPSAKLGLSLQHAGAGPSTTTPSPMASPRVTGYGKPPSQSSFPIAHHASRSPSSPAPPKRTASDAQVISRNSINPRKAVAQSFGSGGGVTMMRSTSSALDTEESETYNPAAAGAGPLPSDSGVALGVVVQPSVSASLTRRVGAAEVKAKDD